MYFISVSMIETERMSKDVKLPLAKQGILEEDDSGRFIIDIEWDEKNEAAKYKVGTQSLGYASEVVPLINKASRGGRVKNFRVVIRADRNVPYEFTQEVLGAVASANIPNVMFSTKEVEY
jgi:biopolymer transport protein ExbD